MDGVRMRSSLADRIIQIICLVLMAGVTIYLIAGWTSFPDQIPMHYGGSGEIDRWGGKGEIILLILLWWGMYLVLSAIERFPQVWNTGVKVTPQNQERVYRTLKYMLKTLKFLTALIFAYLIVNSLQSAPLPGWFTPAVMILVFGDMAFWLIRLFRIKK